MPEIKISELTSAVEPSGGEILAIVQSNTTHKTTIDSLKPALVDNLSTGAPTWTTGGVLRAGHDIIAGYVDSGAINVDAGGTIGLTLNDGYGNANLTFNHTGGTPDSSGSSARITSSVDSNQELMAFQLKSSVTGGTPVTLTTVLRLYEDAIQLLMPATCQTPTQGTHVARKDYVDTALNLKATIASVDAVNSSLTNHIDAGHPTIHAALSHTHPISDITDLQTSLNTLQTNIDGKIGESEINTSHFTFANDTLSLKPITEGQISTGAVTTTKILDHNITAKKLKGTENIAQGNFLIYDAATGGFETTASTAQTHKLFSPNHSDVASNVTPSYGDSMYYNGTEWTTGNFGNYGADMEYVGITGVTGVTNNMLDTRPDPNVDVSGRISSTSLTVDTDLLGTQATTQGNNIEVSGYVTYPIANLVGEGLINDNIRGIYIKVFAWWAIGSGGQKAQINVIYPDGTERSLIASPENRSAEYLGTAQDYDQATEQVFLIPVNEGQENFVIGFDVDDHDSDHERIVSEIIGVQCTKRVALSPEVDVILIKGSQSHLQVNLGYVAAGVNDYYNAGDDIWASTDEYAALLAQGTGVGRNWNGVFPITIPDNVSKTVIRATNNWNVPSGTGESHSSEEIDHITIVIDWNAKTIRGTYVWNAEAHQTGRLSSDNLIGVKQFYTDTSAFFTQNIHNVPLIKFEIDGRDIIKLPCPYHGVAAGSASAYHNVGQTYTIENYKTTAANIIDDIANDASTSSIATSQSVKEYVDENKSTFQKFSDFQDSSVSSIYRTVSYINNNGKLCAVGHGGDYDLAGAGSDYLIAGSSPEIMVPLAAGESVINTFSNGTDAPTMYLLTDQNRVFSTGHNGQGQCGRGGTTQQHYFDRIPQLDGTTWVSPNSGANTDGHMGAVRNGQLYMWGYGNQGQLGNGSAAQANTPILINTGALAGKTITKVYTHTYYGYTFVIDSNRDVYATGYNVEGQLGLGDYTNRNTFAKVPGIKADDIILSHGSNASSSYIINGTTLYSTGDNNVGQLGHGNLTKRNTFLAVPGVSAKTVSVGGHRSANVVCLQTDGTVKVWGHNNRGQLGLGDTTNRSSPKTLTAAGNDVVKALTHDDHGYTAILKADGTIYTAGYNGHGQLGVGDTTNRNTLTKIVMDNNIQFKDIALFGYNSGTQLIAIDQDNGMWGCGYNAQWSLGLNYTYNPITILAKLSIS